MRKMAVAMTSSTDRGRNGELLPLTEPACGRAQCFPRWGSRSNISQPCISRVQWSDQSPEGVVGCC